MSCVLSSFSDLLCMSLSGVRFAIFWERVPARDPSSSQAVLVSGTAWWPAISRARVRLAASISLCLVKDDGLVLRMYVRLVLFSW